MAHTKSVCTPICMFRKQCPYLFKAYMCMLMYFVPSGEYLVDHQCEICTSPNLGLISARNLSVKFSLHEPNRIMFEGLIRFPSQEVVGIRFLLAANTFRCCKKHSPLLSNSGGFSAFRISYGNPSFQNIQNRLIHLIQSTRLGLFEKSMFVNGSNRSGIPLYWIITKNRH